MKLTPFYVAFSCPAALVRRGERGRLFILDGEGRFSVWLMSRVVPVL